MIVERVPSAVERATHGEIAGGEIIKRYTIGDPVNAWIDTPKIEQLDLIDMLLLHVGTQRRQILAPVQI